MWNKFCAKIYSFYKCEYQLKGKEIEKGEIMIYDSKAKGTKRVKTDSHEPKGKELIYILPIQKMKWNINWNKLYLNK